MKWSGWLSVALAPLAVLLMAGCPAIETLRDSDTAAKFIADTASHKDADWRLGSDASQEASEAWFHKESIEELGETLKETPDWACKALDALSEGKEAQLATAEREGASTADWVSLTAKADKLSTTEQHDVFLAVCDVGKP